MSTIITSFILVGILNSSPLHVQFIDKLSSMEACESVIQKVIESEKNGPVEERVGGKLACLTVSYRYDPDGDGPKKPVTPSGRVAPVPPPKVQYTPHEPYPCRNPITKAPVACKEAVYIQ